MQDIRPPDAPHAPLRSGLRSGGYVTVGTLILAAASALVLVFMSGCHSAPSTQAFAATPADKAVEVKLRQADTMPALQPFDEHFVSIEDPDAR